MNIERAIRIRRQAITSISDSFSSAKIYKPTSEELTKSLLDILNSMPKGTPYYVRAFCDGYAQAKRDALYNESLIYGGFIDGVFYSTHRDRPDYYEKHGIEPSEYADDGRVLARGHYWAEPYATGEMRPYFTN